MNREVISDKQGISLLVMIIIGSTMVMSSILDVGKDFWLALVLTIVFSLPMVIIYARITSLFFRKDCFDIIEIIFGKYIGNLINLLYIWYSLHLGSIVLREFSEFIVTVNYPETPLVIPMIVLGILCIYVVKSGIEVMGRIAELILLILIISLLSTVLMLTPNMDFNVIHPLFNVNISSVLKGGFQNFAFPFGEIILFSFIASSFKRKKSSYKAYITTLLVGGLILLILGFGDILVLGEDIVKGSYFPSYTSVSLINIGDFIQRGEITVGILIMLSGFIKISIFLLVASKGFMKVFKFKDYRFIVVPIGLLMIELATLNFESIIETETWLSEVWRYYSFPFQVVLPILIWIGAEIRKKHLKKIQMR